MKRTTMSLVSSIMVMCTLLSVYSVKARISDARAFAARAHAHMVTQKNKVCADAFEQASKLLAHLEKTQTDGSILTPSLNRLATQLHKLYPNQKAQFDTVDALKLSHIVTQFSKEIKTLEGKKMLNCPNTTDICQKLIKAFEMVTPKKNLPRAPLTKEVMFKALSHPRLVGASVFTTAVISSIGLYILLRSEPTEDKQDSSDNQTPKPNNAQLIENLIERSYALVEATDSIINGLKQRDDSNVSGLVLEKEEIILELTAANQDSNLESVRAQFMRLKDWKEKVVRVQALSEKQAYSSHDQEEANSTGSSGENNTPNDFSSITAGTADSVENTETTVDEQPEPEVCHALQQQVKEARQKYETELSKICAWWKQQFEQLLTISTLTELDPIRNIRAAGANVVSEELLANLEKAQKILPCLSILLIVENSRETILEEWNKSPEKKRRLLLSKVQGLDRVVGNNFWDGVHLKNVLKLDNELVQVRIGLQSYSDMSH